MFIYLINYDQMTDVLWAKKLIRLDHVCIKMNVFDLNLVSNSSRKLRFVFNFYIYLGKD